MSNANKAVIIASIIGALGVIIAAIISQINLIDTDAGTQNENVYNKGLTEGKMIGYNEGYNVGYEEGYNVGYNEGYNLVSDSQVSPANVTGFAKLWPVGKVGLYFISLGWISVLFLVIFSFYVVEESIEYCLWINICAGSLIILLTIFTNNIYSLWFFVLSLSALACIANGVFGKFHSDLMKLIEGGNHHIAPFIFAGILLISDLIYVVLYIKRFAL